jgi:GNAT superfamily N-acetyltransferase
MIRPIQPADVPTVVELVHELADYEREPQSCHLTQEQLTAALFCDAPALYGLVAVDRDEDGQEQVVGTALWFLNFSTWRGVHGIYLEDLYVRPAARRGGHGRALLRELARIADARGYDRVDWAVLDWNTPAHAFYRSLGAVPTEEWTGWRLQGQALSAFAAG